MIKRIKQLIETQTSLLRKKAGVFKEEDIECAIDEEIVDCKEIDEEPYVGVPAPILNPIDEWFATPYNFVGETITEKQIDYKEYIRQQVIQEQQEPKNIHQVMYEMATKSGSTTTQLNPVVPIGGSENFQGGSENIHK